MPKYLSVVDAVVHLLEPSFSVDDPPGGVWHYFCDSGSHPAACAAFLRSVFLIVRPVRVILAGAVEGGVSVEGVGGGDLINGSAKDDVGAR